MALLEIRNLTKNFGGLAAVKEVSFDVSKGEILGLIGPNGAGKTTLYNLITGIYKPSSGTIKFDGEDITGLKPHQICRRGIGRTFQIAKPLSGMSITKNVMLGILHGRNNNAVRMKDAERSALEILEFTGLKKKENTLAKELNTPELKRLELARALSIKPKLLALDEVAAGLNPVEIEDCLKLLRKIRENGVTLIVVEHSMKAVMGISDRIIVLHHGEKIADGTPSEIANNKEVIEAYLGAAYSVA